MHCVVHALALSSGSRAGSSRSSYARRHARLGRGPACGTCRGPFSSQGAPLPYGGGTASQARFLGTEACPGRHRLGQAPGQRAVGSPARRQAIHPRPARCAGVLTSSLRLLAGTGDLGREPRSFVMLYSRPTHAPEHQVGRGSVAGLIRGRPVSVQRGVSVVVDGCVRARSCSDRSAACPVGARGCGCFGASEGLLVVSEGEVGFGLVEAELGFVEPEPARRGAGWVGFQFRQLCAGPGRRRRRVAGGQEPQQRPGTQLCPGQADRALPEAVGRHHSRWSPAGRPGPPRRSPGRSPPRARGSACARAGRCGPTVQFDARVR